MKQKVGFMGLGIMGSAMAANVLKAGYPLTVYNRTPGKAARLTAQGALEAPTPRALAEGTDIMIIMVTGPEAIDHLLWGGEGAAAALAPSKVLLQMSSVSPHYTRELAAKLAPQGVTFIDAPVSGTKKPAEEGALIILAGGRQEAVTGLEPLLSAMGKKVVYCGGVGQGSMMKMAINLLLGLMMAGLAEMLNFGRKGGLNLEALLETVFAGTCNAPMFQVKADMFRQGEFPAAFPLKHMTKDCKFVIDTAYETGAPAPLAHLLLHLYRQGVAKGWGDLDFAAIAKVLEAMGG